MNSHTAQSCVTTIYFMAWCTLHKTSNLPASLNNKNCNKSDIRREMYLLMKVYGFFVFACFPQAVAQIVIQWSPFVRYTVVVTIFSIQMLNSSDSSTEIDFGSIEAEIIIKLMITVVFVSSSNLLKKKQDVNAISPMMLTTASRGIDRKSCSSEIASSISSKQ